MRTDKEIINALYVIISSFVPGEDIGMEDSLSEKGIILDSIDLITIVVEIENEFCIELSDEDILSEFDSIADLFRMVSKYVK